MLGKKTPKPDEIQIKFRVHQSKVRDLVGRKRNTRQNLINVLRNYISQNNAFGTLNQIENIITADLYIEGGERILYHINQLLTDKESLAQSKEEIQDETQIAIDYLDAASKIDSHPDLKMTLPIITKKHKVQTKLTVDHDVLVFYGKSSANEDDINARIFDLLRDVGADPSSPFFFDVFSSKYPTIQARFSPEISTTPTIVPNMQPYPIYPQTIPMPSPQQYPPPNIPPATGPYPQPPQYTPPSNFSNSSFGQQSFEASGNSGAPPPFDPPNHNFVPQPYPVIPQIPTDPIPDANEDPEDQ